MNGPRTNVPIYHPDQPRGETIDEIRIPVLNNSNPRFPDSLDEVTLVLGDGSMLLIHAVPSFLSMKMEIYRIFPGQQPILLSI